MEEQEKMVKRRRADRSGSIGPSPAEGGSLTASSVAQSNPSNMDCAPTSKEAAAYLEGSVDDYCPDPAKSESPSASTHTYLRPIPEM